ncbi:MAG: hypothetical protein NTX98_00680 [Candidatus Doudnabacteria bacterium]|nr:hypothetical protein [Candidatus Doudnabacteria bacterium]
MRGESNERIITPEQLGLMLSVDIAPNSSIEDVLRAVTSSKDIHAILRADLKVFFSDQGHEQIRNAVPSGENSTNITFHDPKQVTFNPLEISKIFGYQEEQDDKFLKLYLNIIAEKIIQKAKDFISGKKKVQTRVS